VVDVRKNGAPLACRASGAVGLRAGRDAATRQAGPQERAAKQPAAKQERAAKQPAAKQERAAKQPAATQDTAGFCEFVTSRQPAMLRTAYLLTGNRADAEDLVQAVLAKTFQAWDRIEDRGALDGYVRRAMVNTQISWWRRRRVEEYPTGELPDRADTAPPAGGDWEDTLRRAVDRLPQRMRAAVLLRYYEDLTEAEIASALGVTPGTVKSTVSRAMAKLRADSELIAP
jgi:RNA polymerase sigma-70 factor (sigma-E family)